MRDGFFRVDWQFQDANLWYYKQRSDFQKLLGVEKSRPSKRLSLIHI